MNDQESLGRGAQPRPALAAYGTGVHREAGSNLGRNDLPSTGESEPRASRELFAGATLVDVAKGAKKTPHSALYTTTWGSSRGGVHPRAARAL